jgi:hypothetical protein
MQMKNEEQNNVPNEGCRWNVLGVTEQGGNTTPVSSHATSADFRKGLSSSSLVPFAL